MSNSLNLDSLWSWGCPDAYHVRPSSHNNLFPVPTNGSGGSDFPTLVTKRLEKVCAPTPNHLYPSRPERPNPFSDYDDSAAFFTKTCFCFFPTPVKNPFPIQSGQLARLLHPIKNISKPCPQFSTERSAKTTYGKFQCVSSYRDAVVTRKPRRRRRRSGLQTSEHRGNK